MKIPPVPPESVPQKRPFYKTKTFWFAIAAILLFLFGLAIYILSGLFSWHIMRTPIFIFE